MLRRATMADKLASLATMAFTSFHMDINFSQIFRKQQRQLLDKAIQVLPSYALALLGRMSHLLPLTKTYLVRWVEVCENVLVIEQ